MNRKQVAHDNKDRKLCPQCRIQMTQVGEFWICPMHGQMVEPQSSGSLRIFLSYGHDRNEELVRRIKADLENRGHDVWFDKNEIKGGQDWRRSITDGIVASDRVLSFLSKHSTRDPGVCLDEIGIAIGTRGGSLQTILLESEQDVRPPPSVSHIQWLDMRDWHEWQKRGGKAWEDWYQGKLSEIIAVVENEKSYHFAGEVRELERILDPIASSSRIAQLLKKGFIGREWILEAIEDWRTSEARISRLFCILGAPGVGKSALAAYLAHFGSDKVVAAQFCEYDKPDHRDPVRIVKSLAFQLATRLPDYRKLLLSLPEIKHLEGKGAAELFDYLLAEPLHYVIEGGRERYLIVIDALDEAGADGRNIFVEMLAENAQRIPAWIGIVATSRPESNITALLQGLGPTRLNTATESNRDDIREFLTRKLACLLEGRQDAGRLLTTIVDKSEGVFLYAKRFSEDVLAGRLSLDDPEAFPSGLSGSYFRYMRRQFPDIDGYRRNIRPALRVILASREPLPVKVLQNIFDWHDEEVHDFIALLGSLFNAKQTNEGEVVYAYHKSLFDWLIDKTKSAEYYTSVNEGQRALATYGWKRYQQGIDGLEKYFLRNIIDHLFAAAEYEKVIKCCEEGLLFLRKWQYPSRWVSHQYLRQSAYTLIDGFPAEKRSHYAQNLAESFGNIALNLRSKNTSYDQPWHKTANNLRESDECEFRAYRDSFHKFLYASTKSAIFASIAQEEQFRNSVFLKCFKEKFHKVQEWHRYLTSASAELGLSGLLEDEALELYDAWVKVNKA